jgi:hypothetical protein
MSAKKPDKYLTEMKELPPSYSSDKKKSDDNKNDGNKNTFENPRDLDKEPVQEKPASKEKVEPTTDMSEKKIDESVLGDVGGSGVSDRPYTYKDIILGIVNLISIVLFVIMIINFPKKSKELKDLKIQEIKNEMALGLGTTEIEVARPKAQEINKLFLDEAGIVNFVNDVELQKSEGGAISKVSFASQTAVSDKTGNFGVPIVIELTGSWEAIDADLQKIDSLPYLFRPVKVEIGYDDKSPDEESAEVVVYKYGIFLYVRESLGKNR